MKLVLARKPRTFFGGTSPPDAANPTPQPDPHHHHSTRTRGAQAPPPGGPHLLSRVLLQVPGLALLAGVAVQAVEALLQGRLQLLLVWVSVLRRGFSKLLLEDAHLGGGRARRGIWGRAGSRLHSGPISSANLRSLSGPVSWNGPATPLGAIWAPLCRAC